MSLLIHLILSVYACHCKHAEFLIVQFLHIYNRGNRYHVLITGTTRAYLIPGYVKLLEDLTHC